MNNLPYNALARFYEGIINDSEYDNWLDFLADFTIKNSPSKTGVDCASGSGLFTRKLKSKGCNVYGVDISDEMLEKAIQKNNELKLNIQYIKGDIRTLKCFTKVGFISCINDGINYISQADLSKTFKSFYKNLVNNGTLIFDISSEYKFKTILNGNVYCDDSENLSYIWFNELSKDNKSINISVSFFEKEGNLYKRYNEEQIQYIYTKDEVVSALEEVGFKNIQVFNKNGNLPTDTDDRLLFIAKR